MNKIRLMLCLVCMLLTVSCATDLPTKFEKKLAVLERKSLALMTIEYVNEFREDWEGPIPLAFLLGEDGDDRVMHDLGGRHLRALSQNREFYLFVNEADKGDYFFYSIRGEIHGKPLGRFGGYKSFWEAPVLLNYQVKENEIVYIGNVRLILRKKTSDSEIKAAPGIIPDFREGSMSQATFDIQISDRYERDVNEFEKVFNLKGHNVVKRILPSWKRPSSQEFQTKKTNLFFIR